MECEPGAEVWRDLPPLCDMAHFLCVFKFDVDWTQMCVDEAIFPALIASTTNIFQHHPGYKSLRLSFQYFEKGMGKTAFAMIVKEMVNISNLVGGKALF